MWWEEGLGDGLLGPVSSLTRHLLMDTLWLQGEGGAVSWSSAVAHARASRWIWRCQTSCGAGVGNSDVTVPQEPGKKGAWLMPRGFLVAELTPT